MTARAIYLCIEGTEGVGKTTYTDMLVKRLRSVGNKVLQTKEPGTPLSPLTMELRSIMLDCQHEEQMTTTARELVSEAIRSIHLEKVIIPALHEYDYIIQDRGILSGLAYGEACGNPMSFLNRLIYQVAMPIDDPFCLYDKIIYLKSDTKAGLARAKSVKQEFAAGDAMEAKGIEFMERVAKNMDTMVQDFPHAIICVGNKSIDETFKEIWKCI